jgi:hypothetical protein
MRRNDSGLEILPLNSRIRNGVPDRVIGLRFSALLDEPLSECIQKRYRVLLPVHAPRPGGRSVARVGLIDPKQLGLNPLRCRRTDARTTLLRPPAPGEVSRRVPCWGSERKAATSVGYEADGERKTERSGQRWS